MAKKSEIKDEPEHKSRTATIKELFQTCPKCKGDLLVKKQTPEGLHYKCEHCGYEEFRKWD